MIHWTPPVVLSEDGPEATTSPVIELHEEMERQMNKTELRERIRDYKWFHSIDFGDGIVTTGYWSPKMQKQDAKTLFRPIKISGASVIDIGAWDGFYSFEAKRRGAATVLATDHFVWSGDPQFHGRETFDLAREALGLEVKALDIDVPDLSPEHVGTFDVVLFLGVFYHLFDPIDGLRRAASLAREVLVVVTHIDLAEIERPAMVFYPGNELAGDPTNWWGPNVPLMHALLKQFGFARVDYTSKPRPIFHAWRSDALRP